MLHTKFQASEPSGSKEEDFKFFYAFLWFEPRVPGPPCTLGPPFAQTWYRTTRQWYIPNFKHPSQVVLKIKIFEYTSMHFYGSNLGLPGPGHIGHSFEQTW